jgi:hypothetical protein
LLGNMEATSGLASLVDHGHIGSPGVRSRANATVTPERIPVWWTAVRLAPAGASAVVGVQHPLFGAVVAVVAMSGALTIIGTAMFGSPEVSRRAFRLLCLIGNRPEPRGLSREPTGGQVTYDLAIPPVRQRSAEGAVAVRTQYQARPGRRVIVVTDLGSLRGPSRGSVQLPLRLYWSGRSPVFDLDVPYLRRWLYQIVLREASRPEDLTGYLDRDTLIVLWPELYLPRGVRRAWEEHHPQLRAAGA